MHINSEAQAIMPGMNEVTTLTLTKSFRFGSSIAECANALLMAKACSEQHSTFRFYQLEGSCLEKGIVTTSNLLSGRTLEGGFQRVSGGLTILGYKNTSLLHAAVQLFCADASVKMAFNGDIIDTLVSNFRALVNDVAQF